MQAKITVVGLGSGDENQLSLGIWRKIQSAKHIYVRTAQHPVMKWFDEQGISYKSFDQTYEQIDSFTGVYEYIVEELIRQAVSLVEAEDEIVYAVPGHPMVAERTSQLLKERCSAEGIALHFMGGESFVDQAFLRFGFDPIEGFQLLDGSQSLAGLLNPRMHTLIAQVYDVFTASDVKLSLMELYPDDFSVVVGHALGVAGEEVIQTVPLFELDRVEGYCNLSMVWVPLSDNETLHNRSFHRLQEIVQVLRSPEGCPWDREQTHTSLRKHLLEETYEVLEAIDDDDPDAMREELGDLLLQVLLHAQIEADTNGAFNVYDIVQSLNEKLIRRHPHVFADQTASNSDEVRIHWQRIKQEEKQKAGLQEKPASVLDGIPRDLPGLMKAWKLQKKAAAVGFDWEKSEDVIAKIEEELAELIAEMHPDETYDQRAELRKAELGDLLFSVVNLARFLEIDPEEAIACTNRKFYRRFGYIEEQLRINNQQLDQTSLLEMEHYWQKSKSYVSKD